MNENVKRWVAALRSGEYEQGRKALRSIDDKFCCLGVACELSREELDLDLYYTRPDPDGNPTEVLYDGSHGALPKKTMKWLGLNFPVGSFCIGPEGHNLACLNDDGMTFDQIADVIEYGPNGLFDS